jgi:hypothetical protein
MGKLWTFGCSFTAERNYVSYLKPGDDPERENNDIRYRDYRGGDTDIWPTIVARELGLEKMNLGYPGFSNYRIFNRFAANSHRIEKDDVVIVEWSRMTRFDVINLGHGWNHQINSVIPSEAYIHQQFTRQAMDEILVNRTHPAWCEEIYSYMKLIKELSKSKNFELYFWSADKDIINKESKDFKKEYKVLVPEADDDVTLYLRKYGAQSIKEETDGLLPDNEHYGEVGHIVMAKAFLYDISVYRNSLS